MIIPKVASLELLDGFIADKTYDKNSIGIDKTKIRRIGSTDPIIEEEIKSIQYKQQTAGEEEYEDQAPSNAGKYTVKVTTVATADHKESEITKDFEIKPIVLVGTYSSGTGIYYNGKENERTLIIGHKTCPDILEGDYINLSAKFPKDVGENKDQEAVECTHTGNFNYSIDPSTFKITAEIYPKEIKTAIKATKVYDAKKELVFEKDNWNSVSEIEEIDKSSLQLKLTLDSADVGKPKVLESKLSSPNYKLANDIVITAEITQKKLTLKKSKNDIPYNGTDEFMIRGENINGFIGNDNYAILYVKMKNKDVGATYDSYRIVKSGNPLNNYFIDENEIISKVKIVKNEISFSPLPKENYLTTIWLPSSSSSTSPLQKRVYYLNGVNNEKLSVTLTSENAANWSKNTEKPLSDYPCQLSDDKNYELKRIENQQFKIVSPSSIQPIEINGNIDSKNSGTGEKTVVYKFTATKGTSYEIVQSNHRDSRISMLLGVVSAEGKHYSCYNTSCKFVAEDNSEIYIISKIEGQDRHNMALYSPEKPKK